MDSLRKDPILKSDDNTLACVRNELNLTKHDIKTMVDNFEEWIQKQNHFTKRNFDRHYLETSLIMTKGSLERAKNSLEKLCTIKTLLPHYFLKCHPKEHEHCMDFVLQVIMPKLLKDNYRLYFIKFFRNDFDSKQIMDFYTFSILVCEYMKANDYFLGVKVVIDCRDINILSVISKFNALDLRNSITIKTDGYGFRIGGIHVLSNSNMVDAVITLLKQVVSSKVSNRIFSYQSLESLYEHIDKECLPKEYGGEDLSLEELNEKWIKVLSAEENVSFLEDICSARTDEKRRITSKYNEQVLGMPGSFRSLTVD